MNALIRKEIRLLRPAWITALLLAAWPAYLVRPLLIQEQGSALAFWLGSLVLGLTSFGKEFNAGTFSLLLAQPTPRRRIWRVKVSLLAIAFASVFVVWWLSWLLRLAGAPMNKELWMGLQIGGLLALGSFSGGLWTTLLFRQVAAAFWFTLLIPAALMFSVSMLLEKHADSFMIMVLYAVLGIYAIAGFWWARRLFLRAQDAQWTGGTIVLPAWLGVGPAIRPAVGVPKHKPLRALIWKEIHSHHVSLLIAGVLLLLHSAAIAIRSAESGPSQPNNILHMILEFWWALWLALPLVIGSSAVAEERKLGTLESQLCQPTTRRTQLAIKLAVALLLGTFLGGFMPWLLESAGTRIGVANAIASVRSSVEFFSQPLVITGLASAWITVVSLYASTLTRNTLQAMGAALVVGLTLTGIVGWAIDATPRDGGLPWGMPLVGWIGLPTLLATLFWLSFKNYKHLHVGWNIWLRNLLTILVSVAFAATATGTIYKRPWEGLMTLEPRHGTVQLSGPVRPKICVTRVSRLFALLPDGRLWAANNYEWKELYDYIENDRTQDKPKRRRKAREPVPVGGTFLGPSNWVALASSQNQVAGIQSDGSLWKIFSSNPTIPWARALLLPLPEPERIGTDSNWKAIAAGAGHFLTLKADGTLWGWGTNENGQLGVGPKEFLEPVRIGADSDWAAVFATDATSLGVKRDGSMWKWGQLHYGPNGWQGWQEWKGGAHPQPVRWNLDGPKWVVMANQGMFDLAVSEDGALWAAGQLPNNLLGNNWKQEFTAQFKRIGSDSDWADVAVQGASLGAIKKDGTLVVQDNIYAWRVFWAENSQQPSKYSDWIAIGNAYWFGSVALAADGTLCWWANTSQWGGGTGSLLGPTRRPLWHLNIFAETK